MRIPRIYLPLELQANTTVVLDQRNQHYLIKVLRLKPGASMSVFNGQGGEYSVILSGTEKSACINVQQFHPQERESPLQLHLAQGLSKGERMDYTLQKSAELGVTTITPIITERTVVQLKDERIEKRMAHWQGIIISACEQAGRTRIPQLNLPESLQTFIERAHEPHQSRYILDTEAEESFKTALHQDTHSCFTFLIGPEGGLEESELLQAEAKTYKRVKLGPRILRTETAGPVVLAITQCMKGDMG